MSNERGGKKMQREREREKKRDVIGRGYMHGAKIEQRFYLPYLSGRLCYSACTYLVDLYHDQGYLLLDKVGCHDLASEGAYCVL